MVCDFHSLYPQVSKFALNSVEFSSIFLVYDCIHFTVVFFFFHPRTWCEIFLHCASLLHPWTCCGGGCGLGLFRVGHHQNVGGLGLEDFG